MDETTIVILAVAMFVCMILIAGGGYYYTTTLEEVEGDTQEKKSGYCDGMDVNGVYEYNDEGECVFKKCKNGYINQGGYCIPQRDYEADFDAGYIPVNCEISKYNEGPCVNENGRQLTGEPGRCGTGVKRFMADPDSFTMANSLGECDNFSYTEACEVPCKTVACGARDENYTKTDGVCRGFDGNPIGGDTNRCGTGYQIYEVDPATAGNFETDELRDAWIAENWKDCTPIKKSCDVICEPGMEPSGCKALGNDTEVSWVEDAYGEQACIPKEKAVALLKGDTVYDSVNMPMKKLTRAAAQNMGITSMDQLEEGYSIRYKSGVVDFKDLTSKGCATAELVPCKQPTEDQDCQTEWVPLQSCYDVGCGKPKQMKVVNTIINHAWGMGGECNANVGEEKVVDCEQATVNPCCSSDNDAHWTEPISYTCSEDGTYSLINTSACSTTGMTPIPTKTANCCYVGEWEEGTCNEDEQNGKKKYTRTVHNANMCNNTVLNKGVNNGETFDPNNPTVKYVSTNDCVYLTGVKTIKVTQIIARTTTPNIAFWPLEGGRIILETGSHTFDTPVTIMRVTGKAQAGAGNVSMTAQALDANGNEIKSFSVSATDIGSGFNRVLQFQTDAPAYEGLILRG